MTWHVNWRAQYAQYRGGGGGGGVFPYVDCVGMCGPKEYGFSAVLVINRVSNLADSGHN